MKIRTLLVLAACLALVAPTAEACKHRRSLRRVAVHCAGRVYAQPQPQYVAPAPAYVQPTPQAVTVGRAQGDDAGTFLAMLNQARAQAGRPALAFDAALASYAATNAAVHMPGSSGGAAQCWAGCRSYVQAFQMWRASPAHWSILMNATTSVGIAQSPSGVTANAR